VKNLFLIWAVVIHFFSFSQNYFQQKVDYAIQVSLDTSFKTLKGYEKITYINNSPDTLPYIYFHLYPNATHNKTKTALAKQFLFSNQLSLYFEQEQNLGYIDSLHFKINQNEARFEIVKDSLDIGKLYLNQPLLPNQSIIIETPFYVKIPVAGYTRMGYYDYIFGITQWYPKPAVYDHKGWHPYPYLENGEFYSEFGKFDVSITVPYNYTVTATGCLQNVEEWERIKKIAALSIDYPNIVDFANKLKELNKNGTKTLRFIQDSIHDFAWFASPYFKIAHDSIQIQGKIINTWAYYLPYENNFWAKAAQYVSKSVKYYSEKVGNYPYQHCTAVETPNITEGGMEYPMITSIGVTKNENDLFHVIMHEVGHNWFYGILASDERQQPWIDEGINSFYESDYAHTAFSIPKNDWERFNKMMGQSIFPDFLLTDYFYFGGHALPIGLKSEQYSTIDYYFNAYLNTSSVWFFIKKYLGEDNFNDVMKQLYKQKSFQHVDEQDIKSLFEKNGQRPMDWFFNSYLNNTSRSDYKIVNVVSSETSYTITIKNKRKADFPFSLHIYPNNSSIASHESIQQGFSSGTQTITIDQQIKKGTRFVINNRHSNISFLESNYGNNSYTYRTLLPGLKKVSFRFAGIIDQPDCYDILFFPMAAYNTIDKSMAGLLLYSPQIPYPTFQFRLLPLYSIENKRLNGAYLVEKNIPINNYIQKIKTSMLYQTYSLPKNTKKTQWNDLKFNLEIPLSFNSDLSRWIFLFSSSIDYSTLPFSPYEQELYFTNEISTFKQFNIYKTDLHLSLENNHDFAKFKFNAHLFMPYNAKKKGIDLDYFLGAFLFNHSRYFIYNLFLSGTNGIKDYTYNDVFVDRFNTNTTNTFWQHQFVLNDGMFAAYTPIQSNHWLTSFRASIALPIPPPFYLYATTGTYYRAKNAWIGSQQFPWEIGFEIRMIKNIFAVYFPIKMSNDITSISNFMYGDNYLYKIRFTLRLSQLNPFKYSHKIHMFIE